MERTHLNKAHEAGRRAVNFIRRGQLSEAVDCHLKAAGILHALETTLEKESGCKRSLEEQATFHERQAELAQVLKELLRSSFRKRDKMDKLVNTTTAGERKLSRPLRPLTGNSSRLPYFAILPSSNNNLDIFKQIDEADSLLQIISNRKNICVTTTDATTSQSADETGRSVEFTIRPKNDSDVIEELQMVAGNLRALVDRLLTELNESKEENKELKRRLALYENNENFTNTTSTTTTATSNKRGWQSKPFPLLVSEETCQTNENESISKEQVLSQAMNFGVVSNQIQDIPELDPLEDPDFNEELFSV